MFSLSRKTVSSDFDTIFWYYSSFLLVSGSLLLFFSLLWAIADHHYGLVEVEEKLDFSTYPNWMLFVAGLSLISAFCGYFYVLTKAKFFYLMNVVLMAISSTAEFKNYKKLLNSERTLARDLAIDIKKHVRYYFREGKMDILNEVQTKFECCGWRGPDDYNEDTIPLSCCKNQSNSKICKKMDIYSTSCTVVIADYFRLFFKFAVILYQMHIITVIGCLFITTLVYHLLYKKRSNASKKI